MTYQIAVASSDGIQVDGAFGETDAFLIYEVRDGQYRQTERRKMPEAGRQVNLTEADLPSDEKGHDSCESIAADCHGGRKKGCGCKENHSLSARIEALGDCRSIVCRKIGMHAARQLEQKAIAVFDIDCSVAEALDKIVFYYNRADRWKK